MKEKESEEEKEKAKQQELLHYLVESPLTTVHAFKKPSIYHQSLLTPVHEPQQYIKTDTELNHVVSLYYVYIKTTCSETKSVCFVVVNTFWTKSFFSPVLE